MASKVELLKKIRDCLYLLEEAQKRKYIEIMKSSFRPPSFPTYNIRAPLQFDCINYLDR